MSAAEQLIVGNRVLSTLAKTRHRNVWPGLERVVLDSDRVLYAPGNAVTKVYFPVDCVVSLLCKVDEHRTVEVAMEGNESVVGLIVSLGGEHSCNLSVVRDAGIAIQIDVEFLDNCVRESGPLRDLLNKSVHAAVTQIIQSGVCNRFHSIDARVARWLLMARDRIGSQTLLATQESIARLLGVRRSSVTAAASGFQLQRIIDYRRGRIEILDEDKLHAACCSCYGVIKRQYDSFLQ